MSEHVKSGAGLMKLVHDATDAFKLLRDRWRSPELITDRQIAEVDAEFDLFEVPLCRGPEALTVAKIAILVANHEDLPEKHREHSGCAQMYDRLASNRPTEDQVEGWVEQYQKLRQQIEQADPKRAASLRQERS